MTRSRFALLATSCVLACVSTADGYYAEIAAAGTATPGACPANVTSTSCAADGTATCCPVMFSNSNYGCCVGLGADAVCCGEQSCCPAGTVCKNTPPYSSVCAWPNGTESAATQVCTPGAQYPASHSSLPSMIVIGDSVSIGYTPVVAQMLNTSIFVQHSPWAGGGGTDDIQNGLNCQECFLRTAAYEAQDWDIISFNFGLHDLNNNSAAEATYAQRLVNFTERLMQTGSKLIYVTTTPYMPDRYFNNTVVEDLNKIAIGIMQERNIPIADLYHRVTDKCGDVYKNCSICDDEYNNATGVYCGYHYTPAGWTWLGEFLAPIFQSLLA